MGKLKHLYIGVIFVLTVAGNSYAETIRTVNFEEGTVGSIGNLSYLTVSGNAPQIVTAQNGVIPRSGQYMMRTYLNRETSSTNFRTEATLNSPGTFEKGKEYWFSISIYLPKDWSLDYGTKQSDGIVWQFHDRAYKDPENWRQILPLTVMHRESGWVIINHTYANSVNKGRSLGNLKTFSKTVPYKLGQWTDFVMNVKFSGAESPDDTNGFFKVWVDGQLVLDIAGQNYFGEQQGPYFKFGLYNSAWKYVDTWAGTSSRLLYHDELRIGDANSSFNDISPPGTVTIYPPSPPTILVAQ